MLSKAPIINSEYDDFVKNKRKLVQIHWIVGLATECFSIFLVVITQVSLELHIIYQVHGKEQYCFNQSLG